ncbi:MAG: class I SAM-dependent methyltransferase [Sandaracinaceae bacterium]|nr:class I SAM-dependent methyltransferase [Sandaracinaceae bacterium]MDW8246526.1 class I SAM-dependent methyltransferase [Sandaracinaceae bacterium]
MSEQNRNYYDDFSATYDCQRNRSYHQLIDDIEFAAIEALAQGKNVLEVGCGTGLLLERVARIARSAEGVDLSPRMLEHAKRKGLNVREGDARDLPYPDESFDLVYAFKVFPHIQEIEKAFMEMVRVTRKGGHFVFDVYNRYSLRALARFLGGPRPIGTRHKEDDIFTRWESPIRAIARLPSSVRVERVAGARIFTPSALFLDWPLVGTGLCKIERWASNTPLAWGAGFVIILTRRLR